MQYVGQTGQALKNRFDEHYSRVNQHKKMIIFCIGSLLTFSVDFNLLEFLVMLMTLILVIRFRQQNVSDKDIDIINFVRRSQNFIGGIST